MMKNWIKSIVIMLCGMIVMTSFNSCGNDDEGVDIGPQALVGTWMSVQSEYSTYITFNSDRTGSTWTKEEGKIVDTFVFNWTMSDNTVLFNFIGNYDDDVIDRLQIVSVSSDKMVVDNGEETITFTRVN